MINSVFFVYILHGFSHLYFFYIFFLLFFFIIFMVGRGTRGVGWGREGVPPSRALPDMGSLGSLGRFLFRIQGYLSQHLNQGYLGLFILKNGKNNQFLIKNIFEIFDFFQMPLTLENRLSMIDLYSPILIGQFRKSFLFRYFLGLDPYDFKMKYNSHKNP